MYYFYKLLLKYNQINKIKKKKKTFVDHVAVVSKNDVLNVNKLWFKIINLKEVLKCVPVKNHPIKNHAIQNHVHPTNNDHQF